MLTQSAIRLEFDCRAHRHQIGPVHEFKGALRTAARSRRAFDLAP